MEFSKAFSRDRPIDCVTLGRANMDLYPPLGKRIRESRTFESFVGGSPANIAAGIVKRGLKAGMISKVADDGIGHFVKDYLENFGIDVSNFILEESEARTSLAFAERRRDAATVFYRQNPSDLLLEPSDISSEYISSSKVLFISGTALCQEPGRSAVLSAIESAKRADTLVAIDIDYRPHGWNESDISRVLGNCVSRCQLLIGTLEEFSLAVGDSINSDSVTRDDTCSSMDSMILDKFPDAELVVIKRGKKGANAYQKNGERVSGALLPAALKKPWGAGDAFASSLLASLILGKNLEQSMIDGAAAASLNISGTSCTEAMPTSEEIVEFLEKYKNGTLGSEWKD